MLLDLSDRAKYIVTGNDRLRFLNGQLTNDILGLRPGSAIYACALTAKGKLCADLFVTAAKESLFLDAESVLRESLAARLEKYIIADDVTLEDVTDEFGLFHLMGRESGDAGSPFQRRSDCLEETDDLPDCIRQVRGSRGRSMVPSRSRRFGAGAVETIARRF